MAYYETKVVQMSNDPSVINALNNLHGAFGWMVINTQITNSQDSRIYQSAPNTITTETTTINYATITYQRDREMPHYEELSKLEDEYDAIERNAMNQTISKRSWIGMFIMWCGIAFFCFIIFLCAMVLGIHVLGIIFFLACGLFIYFGVRKLVTTMKANKIIERENAKIWEQAVVELDRIEEKAQAIRGMRA